MEFIFNCPHCQRELAAEDCSRGQMVSCPACRQTLSVPASASAGENSGGPEEVVEILDELRLPAGPVPPLAREQEGESFQQPGLAPSGARRRLSPVEGVPPVYVPRDYSDKRERYRSYDGLHRRTQLVAMVAVVVFCTMLAAIIYLIGRPPGEELAIFGGLKPPAAPQAQTNSTPQLEVGRLTADEQKELLQLTLQAFGNLSPEEGKMANTIYAKITQRQYTTDEQRQYFNVLFQKGVLKMPPAEQQRLRQLFAKTVVAAP